MYTIFGNKKTDKQEKIHWVCNIQKPLIPTQKVGNVRTTGVMQYGMITYELPSRLLEIQIDAYDTQSNSDWLFITQSILL